VWLHPGAGGSSREALTWREVVREEFVREACESFVDDSDFRTESV
jgi:hypothetical protein